MHARPLSLFAVVVRGKVLSGLFMDRLRMFELWQYPCGTLGMHGGPMKQPVLISCVKCQVGSERAWLLF